MSRKSNNNKFTQQQLLSYDPYKVLREKSFKHHEHAKRYINRYIRIIQYYQQCPQNLDSYYELHHIVPVTWGGPDCSSNLIYLPLKAHILVHHILAKTLDKSMVQAFWLIVNSANIDHFRYVPSLKQIESSIKLRQQCVWQPVVNLETGRRFDNLKQAAKWVVTDWLHEQYDNDLDLDRRASYIMSTIPNAIKRCGTTYKLHWIRERDITKSLQQHLQDYSNVQQAKRSKANRCRVKTIINLTTNEIFDAVIDAATKYNVKRMTLADAARRGYRCGGCFWIYKDDMDKSHMSREQILQQRINQYQYNRSSEKHLNVARKLSAKNKRAVINLNTQQKYINAAEAVRCGDSGSSLPSLLALYNQRRYVFSNGSYWILEKDLKTDIKIELQNQIIARTETLDEKIDHLSRSIVHINTKCVYKSLSDAEKNTGISHKTIAGWLAHYIKPIDNIWLYSDVFAKLYNNDYDLCIEYYKSLQEVLQLQKKIRTEFYSYKASNQRGIAVPIYCFNNKKTYQTLIEASKDLNISPFVVQNRSNSKTPTKSDLWFIRCDKIINNVSIEQQWDQLKQQYEISKQKADAMFICIETKKLYKSFREICDDVGINSIHKIQRMMTERLSINGYHFELYVPDIY